jgi:hypothetical protein
MSKFKVQFLFDNPHMVGEVDIELVLSYYIEWLESKLEQINEDLTAERCIMKDKHRVPIFEGQKFRFKYRRREDETIDLVGLFDWNANTLAYVVMIYDHPEYCCLPYVPYGIIDEIVIL